MRASSDLIIFALFIFLGFILCAYMMLAIFPSLDCSNAVVQKVEYSIIRMYNISTNLWIGFKPLIKFSLGPVGKYVVKYDIGCSATNHTGTLDIIFNRYANPRDIEIVASYLPYCRNHTVYMYNGEYNLLCHIKI